MKAEIVYHYASAEALAGIIGKGEIWVNFFSVQNDRKESEILFDLLAEHRTSLLERYPQQHAALGLLKTLWDSPPRLPIVDGYFSCSLSTLPDSLDLWKSYTGGKPGFAIGFDREKLTDVVRSNRCDIVTCVYDKQEQECLLLKLIDETISKLVEEYSDFETRYVNLNYAVRRLAPVFKHYGFKSESEIRIVHLHRNLDHDEASELFFNNPVHVDYRVGRFGLTPYFKIRIADEIPKELVRSVTIGPGHDSGSVRPGLEFLLKKAGLDPNIITESDIPYRY